MKCCENCFSSDYIKPIIKTFSTHKSSCDFCYAENTNVCEPRELIEQFRNIIDLYLDIDQANYLGYDINRLDILPDLIHNKIINDFPNLIFSENVLENSFKLLTSIFADEYNIYYNVLTKPVILKYLFENIIHDKNHILNTKWDNFVEEIKNKNRFHLSEKIDLDLIERLFSNRITLYREGKIFYRARTGNNKLGFTNDNMGNPPSYLAKSGRANPTDISYLYIAESIDTTLYESRAAIYDYVSIGEFKIKEPIRIINLRNTRMYDPFLLAEVDSLRDFILYLPFLSRLEEELSKPIRRGDNELDYLPTQYLSEFIKSLNYDGVEYKSSLNPSGYNIVAFHPEKFECISVHVREVDAISYKHRKI